MPLVLIYKIFEFSRGCRMKKNSLNHIQVRTINVSKITGGPSEMENINGTVELTFPLLLRGVACSYDFQ